MMSCHITLCYIISYYISEILGVRREPIPICLGRVKFPRDEGKPSNFSNRGSDLVSRILATQIGREVRIREDLLQLFSPVACPVLYIYSFEF